MAVPTTSWSELTPAGSDQINAGDNRVRELKTQIREVVDVDHNFPSSGSSATTGFHNQITLIEAADIGSGASGLPILGAQTIDSKAELVFTTEGDVDIQMTKGDYPYYSAPENVAGMAGLLNLIYPIGFVVTLGVSTNPATLFGVGTWTAIAGKVIVGIDGTQTEFDTLNETGGAKTVTLTSAQSGLPAHTHGWNTGTVGGASNGAFHGGTDSQSLSTAANSAADAAEAHTNLQPYIVKYVWERTA